MTIKHRAIGNGVLAALKLTGVAAMALPFIMMTVLAGCDNAAGPGPVSTGRTYTVSANGSVSAATTLLSITFAEPEYGLTAAHIAIANGTGQATKSYLSGSGTSYTLLLTVTQGGTISVTITKDGVDSTAHTVTVFGTPAPAGRTYTVSADGSASAATTGLSITFAEPEAGLTAEHITIANGTGEVTKGSPLSGGGPSYTLPVGVSQGGTISVTITKDGVDSTAHTVTVFGIPGGVNYDELVDYLAGLNHPGNSATNPYTVVINPVNISGLMRGISDRVTGKYIILDLSHCSATGNTITGITNPAPIDYYHMNAIMDNQYIVGIKLPDTLTSIGNYALYDCDYLKSIDIPGSVASIGESAFAMCASLENVIIPGSVASIGESAFCICNSLTTVTFAAGSSIDAGDFSTDRPFDGDLRDVYLAGGGGPGTYTRSGTVGNYTWTKQ
jgi:hypothetical protein